MPDPATPSAQVIEVASTPLDAMGIPATSIKLELGPERRAFVFTVNASARDEMNRVAFAQLAQQLGNLVYPSPAVLVVLPDGEQLGAYRVEAEPDDERAVDLLGEAMAWLEDPSAYAQDGEPADFRMRVKAVLYQAAARAQLTRVAAEVAKEASQ
jgi:hypothetical protein